MVCAGNVHASENETIGAICYRRGGGGGGVVLEGGGVVVLGG